ncbi:FAD-binding oxidoreductase [Bradyrhizobium sp. INPA03-11B]|uniref:FAD-binding oxidoreductase n=1 Tax=Bradyrhizobium sp. INPA03-11B TaxID=418598 RepID=UPI00338EBDC7
MQTLSTDLVAELTALLGVSCIRTGRDIEPRHLQDFAVASPSDELPAAVVYPRNTLQVAAILKLCNGMRVPVVPQGGLTGLAGGATPVCGCVLLSLERMRRIEEIDADAATITVQAGVPLQVIQEAADKVGLFFPLDLGARGTCQIGGNVSTNAGGYHVLRFGMTRDLLLGLEVVLADGTVVSALNKMVKNNAGYDIKQLFVGSEGTLGVITRAVLKLSAKQHAVCTALCGVRDFEQVLSLLRLLRSQLGGAMSAFEMMCREHYAFGCAGRSAPLQATHGAYVLVETLGHDSAEEIVRLERVIASALEGGIVDDVVIAQSRGQSQNLWAIREGLARSSAPYVSFDVSIPIGKMGTFMIESKARLAARWPAAKIFYYGHVADANLHVVIQLEADPMPIQEMDEVLYGAVRDWQGSISAEHGIGLLKREFLPYSCGPEAVNLMKRVKQALDPNNILNPGKIFRV